MYDETRKEHVAETKDVTRLVDKAKTPADEFLTRVARLIQLGTFKLKAYGVDSGHYGGERESASIQVNGQDITISLQQGGL